MIQIHEPVGCIGLPQIPAFTDKELEPLSDMAFEKLVVMAATYRARIESQCEINGAHDEIHD